MDRQTTFADIEDASRRRATKREAFLGPRTRPCPGRSWSPRSSPSTIPASAAAGPSGSRGCCACTSCSCGSASPTRASRTRSTTRGRSPGSWASGSGVGDQVPDATTLLKFRRMIEELNSRHFRFRSAVKNPRETSLAAKSEEAEGNAAETLFVLQRT